MVGYIYLITDTTNGMKYTGKHHYHIEGQLDPSYHGSGVIIKNIYKKRPETLKEEYIKTCYSEEEMCSDEQYYIKFFKTLWPYGYNLTEGGDGVIPCEETRKKISDAHKGKPSPNKGKPMSEEQKKKLSEVIKEKFIYDEEYRRKISDSMKGKHLSEETRRKISESTSGEKHPMFGKHHSEESKRKISESHKGLQAGEKNPMFGKNHSEETRKKMSESHKNISDETRKKMSKSHKGKPSPNKGKPISEEQKKKLSKKVLQFTLSGEFVREWFSATECGRNGYSQSKVCLCCQGKRKSHKGFKWSYA